MSADYESQKSARRFVSLRCEATICGSQIQVPLMGVRVNGPMGPGLYDSYYDFSPRAFRAFSMDSNPS